MKNCEISIKNQYELFLLTDEWFIDKYALLSALMIKISQSIPCHIRIINGWVCLHVMEDTGVLFFSYVMDGYVNVFQE